MQNDQQGPIQVPQRESHGGRALHVPVVITIVALIAAVIFALYAHRNASQLAAQNQQLSTSLSETKGQLDALASKISALTPAPADVSQSSPVQPAAVPHRSAGTAANNSHGRRGHYEDPRWKKLQGQLDEQGKAIAANRQDLDSTRQDLSSAKTELSGSIAHTHDELVVLQKKGERNYYEFDVSKSKQYAHSGNVGIRLKKANQKKSYADLDLTVDDATVSKKHVNLYEPVMFYPSDTGIPVELVINQIGKDHIHGYVSEPKYRRSELAAMSQSAPAASTATASAPASSSAAAAGGNATAAPAQRHKLSVPE